MCEDFHTNYVDNQLISFEIKDLLHAQDEATDFCIHESLFIILFADQVTYCNLSEMNFV